MLLYYQHGWFRLAISFVEPLNWRYGIHNSMPLSGSGTWRSKTNVNIWSQRRRPLSFLPTIKGKKRVGDTRLAPTRKIGKLVKDQGNSYHLSRKRLLAGAAQVIIVGAGSFLQFSGTELNFLREGAVI